METKEEREVQLLVDSTRHAEARENESNHEHKLRLFDQNERQKQLLSKETSEKIKAMQ